MIKNTPVIKKSKPVSKKRKKYKKSKKKKRKKPVKLEAISMHYCYKKSWLPEIVERWIIPGKKKKDFLGFIDMLVCIPNVGILGVQITTKSNMNARIKKIKESPKYPIWKQSFGKLQVWGWYKKKNNGPWLLDIIEM